TPATKKSAPTASTRACRQRHRPDTVVRYVVDPSLGESLTDPSRHGRTPAYLIKDREHATDSAHRHDESGHSKHPALPSREPNEAPREGSVRPRVARPANPFERGGLFPSFRQESRPGQNHPSPIPRR